MPGALAGAPLVGSSMLAFLLPLAGAVAGAWLLDHSSLTELLGALAGLALGMLVVRGVRSLWTLAGGRAT